jgi:hypothetical protein
MLGSSNEPSARRDRGTVGEGSDGMGLEQLGARDVRPGSCSCCPPGRRGSGLCLGIGCRDHGCWHTAACGPAALPPCACGPGCTCAGGAPGPPGCMKHIAISSSLSTCKSASFRASSSSWPSFRSRCRSGGFRQRRRWLAGFQGGMAQAGCRERGRGGRGGCMQHAPRRSSAARRHGGRCAAPHLLHQLLKFLLHL